MLLPWLRLRDLLTWITMCDAGDVGLCTMYTVLCHSMQPPCCSMHCISASRKSICCKHVLKWKSVSLIFHVSFLITARQGRCFLHFLASHLFACIALSCSNLSPRGFRRMQENWGPDADALKQLGYIKKKKIFEHSAQKIKHVCTVIMIKGDVTCFKDRISLVCLFASVAAPASNLWRVAVFLDWCGPCREPGERCRQVSLPIGCSR